MKTLRSFFALSVLLALGACATDFNGRLATGYQTVTGVRTTTLTLLQADKIKAPDAQNVQDTADKARVGLDIARDVHATAPDLGEDKLKSASAILKSLQKYLGDITK